jgi:hypothetical protein
MTDNTPKMIPRQLAFFSDWYVQIIWPSGRKERVDGFESEAHARGWIEHESGAWLDTPKRPLL